ncbi:hypothetical protein BLX24_10940 [Arsenicibacter rosenii]|uniref:VTC domain-containing protein n=2 Tax=Arsenicibacter rosenii TaxID=1750698 RepID=A0A1S2VMQ6_9BACT|nr:hypothetical protein BLX24_10940 [Arsenicibacter rosenii]
MTTNRFQEAIEQQLSQFDPISLDDMDAVKLMDRTDTKFLVPLARLPALLDTFSAHYRLLTIHDTQQCRYQTLYYDTADLRLYHLHQSGKLNRFKVRARTYVESAISFFEVKHKNNKGRTVKKRIPQPAVSPQLSAPVRDFLSRFPECGALPLEGLFWIDYTRLTLVGKQTAERLTIDLNLTFRNDTKQVGYPELVIIELKQNRAQVSVCRQVMKQAGLRQGGISKYCFGVMNLYPSVKQNNFKRHWQAIRKTQQQHAAFATTHYPLNRNVSLVH